MNSLRSPHDYNLLWFGVILCWLLWAAVLCLPPLFNSLRQVTELLDEHNAKMNEEIRRITH